MFATGGTRYEYGFAINLRSYGRRISQLQLNAVANAVF